jgi:hypothetical protein
MTTNSEVSAPVLTAPLRAQTPVIVTDVTSDHFNRKGVIVSSASTPEGRMYGVRFNAGESAVWFVAGDVEEKAPLV